MTLLEEFEKEYGLLSPNVRLTCGRIESLVTEFERRGVSDAQNGRKPDSGLKIGVYGETNGRKDELTKEIADLLHSCYIESYNAALKESAAG